MDILLNALRGAGRLAPDASGRAGGSHRVAGYAGLPVWLTIAAVAAAVVSIAAAKEFTIAWQSFAVPALTSAALAGAAQFYGRYRGDPGFSAALQGTAQIVAFAAVGAPLSYLAASAALPLQDAAFDAADKALGFDWLALLAVMNAHPALQTIASAAYMSFAPQATITILVLGLCGRPDRLNAFVVAFVLTTLATIAISAAVPAEGVWSHYRLAASEAAPVMPYSHTSWPVFHGLRDGSVRTLVATGSEGIITFPSLHAALGILFAAALWPVRWLRWPAVALNAAMIAATPIDGSHYLVDVLVGVAIALACWWAAQRFAGAPIDARGISRAPRPAE